MSLIVSERGRQEAIDYYQALIDATKDAAAQNIFPVEKERHRLLWDNIVTWYNFQELKSLFAENNIALVSSNYLDSWKRTLDDSSYDALLKSMASAYSTIYTNFTVPQRIELYKEMVIKYKADGCIFHNNLSCHTASLRVNQIAKALEDHFGPEFRTVTFEGCQGIEGRFQKHAFETGINVHFIER